ncbi:hypothetical protein Dimus_014960 [Dionaea muscipula]
MRSMKKRVVMEEQQQPRVPYLSAELWSSILARLPVQSLLRFRCVCKLWCDIIESSEFQVLHLSLYTSSCILSRTSDCFVGPYYWTVIRGDTFESLGVIPRIAAAASGSHRFIEGSVNGLVLLSVSDRMRCSCTLDAPVRLILWNPSIRKHVEIPPPTDELDESAAKFGLGYDEVNNDYKVLAVSHGHQECLPGYACKRPGWRRPIVSRPAGPAMVYSVRKGCWKTLPGLSPTPRRVDRNMEYFKGKLYWIAYRKREDDRKDHWKLASFDICSELFHHTALPRTKVKGEKPLKPITTSLHILNGSIAILDLYSKCLWIWVMGDAGNRSSCCDWVLKRIWSFRPNTSPYFEFLHKHGEGEEILFTTDETNIMKFYDVATGRERSTTANNTPFIFTKYMDEYVENLLLLKAGEGGACT